MPTTPSGTRFFPIIRPFGRFFMERTSPIGSSKAATCCKPSAIWAILASFSIRRSNSPSGIWFFLPFSRSSLFAAMMSADAATRADATAVRARFFSLVPNVASFWDAALAPWHICSSSMVIPFLSVKCLYGVAAIPGRNSAVVYVYCGDT